MTIYSKRVAILVPVYKPHLDALECISLSQLIRVLGEYPIFYLAPESLKFDYGYEEQKIRFAKFPDDFFKNSYTYSRLMLSEMLYEFFLEYEYILIYQLDAFVFSNQLQKFCSLGYDYIGAPLQRFHQDWKEIGCNVGNGGFSLRKVSSCLRVVRQKEKIFERKPASWKENRFLGAEDVFFSFCSTIKELNFSIPPFSVALVFAVGTDIAHVYKKMPKWLPFGCHAWTRIDYWAWKPIIETFGYKLPVLEGFPAQSARKCDIYEYVVRRCCRSLQSEKLRCLLKEVFPAENFDIWGDGNYGKICVKYLHGIGKKINHIYDIKYGKTIQRNGIWYSAPEWKMISLSKYPLIIASRNFEHEIKKKLIEKKIHERRHIIMLSDMFEQIFKEYMAYFQERSIA